jgi:hypothetical protein
MADKANKPYPVPEGGLKARQAPPTCAGNFVRANVDDMIVCFNFLVALGNYDVEITRDQSVFGLEGAREVAYYQTAHVIGVYDP